MAETTSSYITATQSGWRYYLRLAANSFATMLDLGLYALGAALAGSGLALLLASFGVVQRDSGLSTGSSLVTSMVLAVVGAFLMGIASEGPARRDNLVIVNSELDRALSRAVASVVVGAALDFSCRHPSPEGGGLHRTFATRGRTDAGGRDCRALAGPAYRSTARLGTEASILARPRRPRARTPGDVHRLGSCPDLPVLDDRLLVEEGGMSNLDVLSGHRLL